MDFQYITPRQKQTRKCRRTTFQMKRTCSDCSSPSSLTLSAETYCSEGLAIASHPSNQVRKTDSSFSCLTKLQRRVTNSSRLLGLTHWLQEGLCVHHNRHWEATHFCHWARRVSNKVCFSLAFPSIFSYFCCNAVTFWAASSLLTTFRAQPEREARVLLSFSTVW